jgi:tetratricopeptide (TPR) repeat protein
MSAPASIAAPSREFTPWLGALLLIGAIVASYANSLRAPFIFDDLHAIPENASIRRLASADIFSPPTNAAVSGRPLVNVTLAVNYAFSGTDVRGYRAGNILIHSLAALTLFGLLRRTLLGRHQRAREDGNSGGNAISGPALSPAEGIIRHATPTAFTGALLWALHPLQTESVTYIVQRTESLMGLCFLFTLYAFARGWLAVAVVACALGMAAKEVMVTAPLVVLLYDRAFLAGSWGEMFRRRRKFYFALAGTWLLLAILVAHAGSREGTAGLYAGATAWGYALTQTRAILHYLRLIFWPHPLVLDYGLYAPPVWREILPSAVALGALLIALALACRRRPAAAFVVACFFLVLAPTSSVLPIITEPMAERRLYLPLASLATLAAVGATLVLGRRGPLVAGGLAVALGLLTMRRNADYLTERGLWSATVAAMPENPRAHYSLALALIATHETAAAEEHFQRALALQPNYVGAHQGYATLLASLGRPTEAATEYRAVLRTQPHDFVAHLNLGTIAFEAGDLGTAAKHFEHALRARPDSAEAHNDLGCVLYAQGDWPAARAQAEEAIRLQPNSAQAHHNFGNALNRLGRLGEARAVYERALALEPDYFEAHVNLAGVLERTGESAGAIAHYRAALKLVPDHAFSRQHLDALLATPQR